MPDQTSRLRAPKPGETIRWVPKAAPSPAAERPQTADDIDGVTRAQMHQQAVRLSEGRGPAEPGEGLVPTAQPATDAETRRYLNEQRERFREPSSK